jgi:methyl-accepting chemotaxis protein
MSIKRKLALVAVLLVILPSLAIGTLIGWQSYQSGRAAIEEQARNQLTVIRDIKKQQIEAYFATIRHQARTSADSTMTQDAMQAFTQAFAGYREELGLGEELSQQKQDLARYYQGDFGKVYGERNPGTDNPMPAYLQSLGADTLALQHRFIAANPNPLGSKDALLDPADGSRYAEVHKRFHPRFRDFLQRFEYYDIFLVEPQNGVIVYSVFKELDFATSLKSGPYAQSKLGEVFRAALSSQPDDPAPLSDFAPYAPSYEDPAAFVGYPIREGDKLLGVLIFQMPINRINAVMTHDGRWKESGLGASGETYLVGPDGRMRSQSRFLLEDKAGYLQALQGAGVASELLRVLDAKGTAIGLQVVDSAGSRAALAGESGFMRFADYRGVSVLSAFAPLEIAGLRWALLSEIDEAEAFASSTELASKVLRNGLFISLGLLLLGSLSGWWIGAKVTAPIIALAKTIGEIERDADLTRRLDASGRDELGDAARALNQMLDKFQAMIRKMIASAQGQSVTTEELAALTLQTQQGALRQEQESDLVATASTELTATIEEVAHSAQNAAEAAQEADHASCEGQRIVLEDIRATGQLAEEIDQAMTVINRLDEDVLRIGGVLEVIGSIAEQTNLLALNAAIEAARAGDQGRGFAVVADEVRSLALRTQQSTAQIQTMIEQLQKGAKQAVGVMHLSHAHAQTNVATAGEAGAALERIAVAVHTIVQMNEQIATAAEQQHAVAEGISLNIHNVNEVAKQNAGAAWRMSETSRHLAQLGQELHAQAMLFHA